MNHQALTTTLLLLALGCAICATFAQLVPGAWWQWLTATALLGSAGIVNAALTGSKEAK